MKPPALKLHVPKINKLNYAPKTIEPEEGPEKNLSKIDKNALKFLETIFVLLSAPFYWLISLTAIILFFLPCFLLRWLIILTCKLIHPTWTPVSIQDNLLAEEGQEIKSTVDGADKHNSIILILLTLSNPAPNIKEFKEKYVQEFLNLKDSQGKLLFPKYFQYLQRFCGYNFWKWDKEFNIDNHIKILQGTENLEQVNEDKLMELLGRLTNQAFIKEHPLWDILFVENYVGDDGKLPISTADGQEKNNNSLLNTMECANNSLNMCPITNNEQEINTTLTKKTLLVFRVHHAMADGYSLLKTNLVYLFKGNLNGIVKPNFKNTSSSCSSSTLLAPIVKFCNAFYTIASLPFTMFKQQILEIDFNALFKSESKLTRDCIATRSINLPIQLVKGIKDIFGVSFNAVTYSALAAGFRKYLIENHDEDIPNVIRSFAPFPWKNHPNGVMVNHWTCAVVPILTGISDPIERLLKTEEEFGYVKSSSAPLANYISIQFTAAPPAAFTTHCAKNWYSTAIVSAFPGPKEKFKIFGEYLVEDECFWAPHLRGSAGIGIAVFSYADTVRICMNVDKAIIKDRSQLNKLVKYMEQEIYTLGNLAESIDKNVRDRLLSIIPEEVEEENWKSMPRSRNNSIYDDEGKHLNRRHNSNNNNNNNSELNNNNYQHINHNDRLKTD